MSNVLVIGAQNIDIFVKTNEEYTLKDSNMAKVHLSYGGVGRNICENLKRLNNEVSFLTVFGDDQFSTQAKDSLQKLNINIEESKTVTDSSNSIYMGILDKDNDLYLGINDMDITSNLNKEYLESKLAYINTFNFVVIDNNLTFDAIEYLVKNITAPIIIDAVSAKKVLKLKKLLKYITVLKVNKIELDMLVKGSLEEQIKQIKETGLKNLLITDGPNKIHLVNNKTIQSTPLYLEEIVNASGAGDAFLSGFVHGMIQNKNDEEKLHYAKKCAYHTLLCDTATSTELNEEVLS